MFSLHTKTNCNPRSDDFVMSSVLSKAPKTTKNIYNLDKIKDTFKNINLRNQNIY